MLIIHKQEHDQGDLDIKTKFDHFFTKDIHNCIQ